MAKALTAPVGFPPNDSSSFTAYSTRPFGCSARNDGSADFAATPSTRIAPVVVFRNSR